jgi:hypothetical protein
MEVWKCINENYSVSNLGNVKSNNYRRTKKEGVLKNFMGGKYYSVELDTGRFYVHRLVAEFFLENKENKKCVNHIDGNKLNNYLTNLEWVTHSENNLHSFKMGLSFNPKGENNKKSKLKNEDVFFIRNSKLSQSKLGLMFNVSGVTIYKIKSRKKWKHI